MRDLKLFSLVQDTLMLLHKPHGKKGGCENIGKPRGNLSYCFYNRLFAPAHNVDRDGSLHPDLTRSQGDDWLDAHTFVLRIALPSCIPFQEQSYERMGFNPLDGIRK